MVNVYLVRHGETAWSQSGRHTGRTDVPLTPQGEQNARSVGARLTDIAFAAVFSSPSQRARRTAELAGFADRAAVEQDLAEWDYGALEGLTTPQVLQRHAGWELFRDGCPGGESVQAMSARADRVLGKLTAMDGNVLLFSSGHISRVIAARWLGLEASAGRLFYLGTAALSILGSEHENPVLRLWNDRGLLTTSSPRNPS